MSIVVCSSHESYLTPILSGLFPVSGVRSQNGLVRQMTYIAMKVGSQLVCIVDRPTRMYCASRAQCTSACTSTLGCNYSRKPVYWLERKFTVLFASGGRRESDCMSLRRTACALSLTNFQILTESQASCSSRTSSPVNLHNVGHWAYRLPWAIADEACFGPKLPMDE